MDKPEVFLSYSTKDAVACERIEKTLSVADFTVWRDKRSITPGNSWVKSIFKGINSADFVVPLLSLNSIQSRWVEREVETALAKSMTRDSALSIVPVILEPVQIPDELMALQCIDFSEDFDMGLDALVKHIRKSANLPFSDSSSMGDYASSISKLDGALFGLLDSSQEISQPNQDELWHLHQHLIRLQAIVEQIAKMSADDAESLWHVAGKILPGPISGPDEIANHIKRGPLQIAKDKDEKLKISLVCRYVSNMGDVVKSLRSSAMLAIPITNPDIADQLTRLFQSKVSIYRSIARLQAEEGETAESLDDNFLDYIEAARSLEARGLLQLIDADARSVAQKGRVGLSVFSEIAADGVSVIRAIVGLRQRLGSLLKSVGFNAGGPNVA